MYSHIEENAAAQRKRLAPLFGNVYKDGHGDEFKLVDCNDLGYPYFRVRLKSGGWSKMLVTHQRFSPHWANEQLEAQPHD